VFHSSPIALIRSRPGDARVFVSDVDSSPHPPLLSRGLKMRRGLATVTPDSDRIAAAFDDETRSQRNGPQGQDWLAEVLTLHRAVIVDHDG
jgi:hypothetical protein